MTFRTSVLLAMPLLIASSGFAKDKTKSPLPFSVLRAQTVAVVVDPDAGISVDDPLANQTAQKDVETALLKWGRYNTAMDVRTADLIIVVRKGHSHLVDDTISDPRQNNRPGAINSTDNAIAIGAQHGPQGSLSDASNAGSASTGSPHPGTEIGPPDDLFALYQGGGTNPLDNPVIWRYTAKDGLRSHDVPAVEQFRKAVAETEKVAAKNP